jgi:hypothetical protein
MKAKVRVIQRVHSWTVIDLENGFRICNSYQESKDPDAPSRIHDRFDEVVASCSAESATQAYRAVLEYRRHHKGLNVSALEDEVRKWK